MTKEMIFNNRLDNTSAVTVKLLEKHKVGIVQQSVSDLLQSHPDYPSMLSVSQTLKQVSIDNVVVNITSKESIIEVPTPFIAHIDLNEERFILVEKCDNKSVIYSDETGNNIKETTEKFYEKWSGIVLISDPIEEYEEDDYKRKHITQKITKIKPFITLSLFIIVIMTIAFFRVQNFPVSTSILLLINLSGLVISSLLVYSQYSENNFIVKSLCNIESNQGCNDVLKSRGATLLGIVKWSDVGFVFFMTIVLFILSISDPTLSVPLVKWISICAIPYSVYSTYYQGLVIKQWCTLCVSAQVCVVLSVILTLTIPGQQNIGLSIFLNMIVASLFSTGVIMIFNLIMDKKTQINILYNNLMSYKRVISSTDSFLLKQEKMPSVESGITPIVIGEQNATNNITIVVNPFCGPCSHVYKKMINFLKHRSDFKVNFIIAHDGEEGRAGFVAKNLLNLSKKGRGEEGLRKWFTQEEKDSSIWEKDSWTDAESKILSTEIIQYRDWCRNAKIKHTPTVYINGFLMPEEMEIEDFRWLE